MPRDREHKLILAELLRRTRELEQAPGKGNPLWEQLDPEEWERQEFEGPSWGSRQWFGQISEAERRRFGRALKDLERPFELVVTYGTGDKRATHVRLTWEGRELAERLERGDWQPLERERRRRRRRQLSWKSCRISGSLK